MSRFFVLPALALCAALCLSGCGLDCAEYCAKMDDCDDSDCDATQCENFCEQALDSDEVGFESSATCALDESCDNLKNGACFPWGDVGREWCD